MCEYFWTEYAMFVYIFKDVMIKHLYLILVVDTPDSRVEIVVPLSLEKRQLTKTVEAKSNPIWNETLVFHVDTSHEDLAECGK